MKKFFKCLTIMLVAVCAAAACAVALTACKSDTYTFLIQYEDGSAVNGLTGGEGGKVSTQICEVGESGQCVLLLTFHNIYPDENGKLTLTQSKINELFGKDYDVTTFAFHVLNVPDYYDCEYEVDGAKEYICKLYNK